MQFWISSAKFDSVVEDNTSTQKKSITNSGLSGLLEFKTWYGKHGKPEKLLEYFYFFPEKYFLAESVYFRYDFSQPEKIFVQNLKNFGFYIHYSIEKPFLREKISGDFLKIWPRKPGKLLGFFLKVLTTMNYGSVKEAIKA